MADRDRAVEELLSFLLTRLDDVGFDRLLAHEPTRMAAAYVEASRGRVETRGVMFTGCGTCSQLPPGSLFPGFAHIDVEVWPCPQVRSLVLPFADDPDYRDEWRPEYAAFASGTLLHHDHDLPQSSAGENETTSRRPPRPDGCHGHGETGGTTDR